MCGTCGCGERDTEVIDLEERVLARNDRSARHNRGSLDADGVHAVNLMDAPGSGKTSLLERTIAEYGDRRDVVVIEGDQETRDDADRIGGQVPVPSR